MNIIFDKISPLNKDLRHYQITAKEDIYKAFKIFRSVMFQMPTGTGKTRMFSSIIKDLHEYGKKRRKPIKILILAHREELISQISESIGKKYGIAHGKIKARHDEEHYYPTQIASVQTLYRRIEKWIRKDFDLIIIDEAHHVLAKTYRYICNKFPKAKLLGVTATPYRLNAEPFPPMFDILIQSMSIYQFIKEGHLCEYEYYSIKPQSSTQQMINNISVDFSGDYDENEMLTILDNKRVRANILETYEKYAKGKKGIVYTINKVHNFHVYETFKENGYATALIDSDTPAEERKEIVQQFKSGSISILCNVNIFSEGFNCPDVEFIQLARPTLSLAMYLQQVGRGFRIHEKKDKVIFLDNVGLFNRFGLPSANRQWKFYFEGKHKGIEFNHSDEVNTSFIIKPIKEGIEEVELLYDSKQEQEEPNELFWESERRGNTQIVQKSKEMETIEIKARIQELELEIDVFKKYERQVPEILQTELDKLKKYYEKVVISEQFIPQLQNFLWVLKKKFIFQNDFNFFVSYDKKEFNILFDNQIYGKYKYEYMQLDESQSAVKKVISSEIKADNKSKRTQRSTQVNNIDKEARRNRVKGLIEAGKSTRKELMEILRVEFPEEGKSHTNSNILSECKNPERWKRFGNFGGLVVEDEKGRYRFAENVKKER
ncbi:MAG: DEAD/DEAH box helicase [Mariniphaga sp.]|nr:DEAD/DEAH box helicase [Mariniphaga sp.]